MAGEFADGLAILNQVAWSAGTIGDRYTGKRAVDSVPQMSELDDRFYFNTIARPTRK